MPIRLFTRQYFPAPQLESPIIDINPNSLPIIPIAPAISMTFLEEPRKNMSDRALKLVIIESPYAGDIERNLKYARACMADSLRRGEMPFASHLLYTQEGILDDSDAPQRKLGIDAGLAWGRFADMTVVYTDLGISEGMWEGIGRASDEGRPIEYRSIECPSD